MKIQPYSWLPAVVIVSGLVCSAPHAQAKNIIAALSAKNQSLQATIKAGGAYELDFPAGGWKLEGKLPGATSGLRQSSGRDKFGAFHQISISFLDGKRTAQIRVYDAHPVALFRDEWRSAGANLSPFPTFKALPQGPYRLSFQQRAFGHYEFGKLGPEGPWVLFDKQDHAIVLSPADHFLVSNMAERPDASAVTGIDPTIKQMPAGFTHSTLIAAGKGVNQVFATWGSALLALGGKRRPANNADVTLAKLGYWTDNETTYYYKFVPNLGYAGTLLAVRDEFKKLGVPLGYMQLDSWFYPKGPQFRWNAGGSTLQWGEDEYRADKTLFPQGLAAFHRDLGLPLVTHARWVSPQSPYHQQFKMSGNVVIDPKFWHGTADYLRQAGVVTHEQDWLDKNAHTEVNLTDPPAFLGEMSRSMAADGLSIQYCMPLPGDYMASTLYSNVQTVRTSGDGFERGKWDAFLYDSRLATAVGLWPWTDAFFSKDLGNLVISTLSAGPVGVGDALGGVNVNNLLAVVRKDGTIIKPDTSLLPIDAVYHSDAAGDRSPMVAMAATNFGNAKIHYVFAYPRQASDAEVTVPLQELGISGPVYAYNWVTHTGRTIPANGSLHMEFTNGWAYQVLTPMTRGGLALLGETDKITPLGRARVASLIEDRNSLSATIQFAKNEAPQTISGYGSHRPKIKALSGTVADVKYDAASHIFTFRVSPGKSQTAKIKLYAH